MKIFNTILIDDELSCLEVLKAELENACPEVKIQAICNSAKEGLKVFNQIQPDLIFLDIDMPFIDGFEFLELLPSTHHTEIIFVTAFNKYAIQAIRTSAADYILKPVNETVLSEAIKRLIAKDKKRLSTDYNFLANQIKDLKDGGISKIALPTFEGIDLIKISTINYCQADNNYTYIFQKNNAKTLITKPLTFVEELLVDSSFFRCHKSYLVNLKYIDRFLKVENIIVTENQERIPVSRRRKNELLSLINPKME